MSVLNDRLAALNPRERLVLGTGILAAIGILVYTLLWQPWQAELERLRTQVPEKRQTLAWMTQQLETVRELGAQPRDTDRDTDLPLLTTLERSASQATLRDAITRMDPGDDADQVRIWMEDADFDAWLRWLQTLSDRGIEVAEANISRTADNRADIRTTLRR